MSDTSTNPAPAGSEGLHPSMSLEEAAGLDFHDPGEDTVEAEEELQSGDETDEGDDAQEADETEGEVADEEPEGEDGQAEGDEDPEEAPELADDTLVALPSGEKLALNELKLGYLRQSDYSRKTQEVATTRRELEALSNSVTQAVEAIADHLTKTLPQEPEPHMAVTNPAEYVRRKALHDQAMRQISQVIEQAQAPKEAMNRLSEQQRRQLVAAENAKLMEAFPQISTPAAREKFFDAAFETAQQLGFSEAELDGAVDHRLFKLAHYARLGLQAEQAKAKAAQKVAKAPPVAPAKRQPGKSQAQVQRNRQAMARLSKTGSIDDALSIDFD